MMKNSTGKTVIALAILLFTSCGGGGGGSSVTDSSQPDYSGNYSGNVRLEVRATALWGQKRTLVCSGNSPLTITITGNQATLVLSQYFGSSFYMSGHAGECIEYKDVFTWTGLVTADGVIVDTGYGTINLIFNGSSLYGSAELKWSTHILGDEGAKIEVQDFWYLSAAKK